MADPPEGTTRRGRPRAGEEDVRRRRVLDAAVAEVVEHGYEATTMLAVARRAGSSKETLYTWFGNKEGLFVAMIREQAAETNRQVEASLSDDREPLEVLVAFSRNLLRLLLGPTSVALNRAAMSSPELAAALLRHGRHSTGPLVEDYLDRLAGRGVLAIDDSSAAFQLLYGLTVQDLQIRALLGDAAPTPDALAAHARRAAERFLALTAPDGDARALPSDGGSPAA